MFRLVTLSLLSASLISNLAVIASRFWRPGVAPGEERHSSSAADPDLHLAGAPPDIEKVVPADPACLNRLEAARAEVERASEELRGIMPVRRLFRIGQPNEMARQEISKVLSSLLSDDGGATPSHIVECRDRVCRLSVVRPEGEKDNDSDWMLRLQRPSALQARLSGGVHLGGGGWSKDPLTGTLLYRRDAYVRLARADGAPVADGRN